jgi:mono/diheme cytochrome c family protein
VSAERGKREGGRGKRGLRAVGLVATILLSGCSWFTDFKQQPKIDPWETPSDTIPFRGNPQGSVPITGSYAPGFEYDRTPMPQTITLMANIKNPVPADSASVARGRIQFQINCAPCHGPLGLGNGPATKYGMVGPAIGAGSNAANALSDGYIFGMIRNGRGLMPTYNRIEEMDRWDIVNYLRSIQGRLPGIAADTSHGRPGETGSLVPGASTMGPTRPAPYYNPHRAQTTPAAPAATDSAAKAATDSAAKTATDTTRKPERQP